MGASADSDLGLYIRLMAINGGGRLLEAERQHRFLAACAKGLLSSREIASRCGTQEKPTRLLMDGLIALGLAEEREAQFHLTSLGKMLVENPQILGDRFWDHLPKYLKTGEPLIKMDAIQHQAEHYQAEVGLLGWMMGPCAEEAARVLGIGQKRKGLRILDVGAGSAVWSLAMARRDRASTVTALDWPEVLAVAQTQAKAQNLDGQLTLLPGDFHEIQLPADAFDLAILANLTHLQTPERNLEDSRKIHGMLRPGGEAVVIDVFPGSPQGDLVRFLYQMGLALRTEKGEVHSKESLNQQLLEAGFETCDFTLLQSPPQILGMLVATKGR